jgi:hypothetical protein
MGQKPPQWDGKIYRAAKPGEGFRWDTADGAQRRPQIARQRRRYAQRRLEEEWDSPELAREPAFIGRVWEEIRDLIFLRGRRY